MTVLVGKSLLLSFFSLSQLENEKTWNGDVAGRARELYMNMILHRNRLNRAFKILNPTKMTFCILVDLSAVMMR